MENSSITPSESTPAVVEDHVSVRSGRLYPKELIKAAETALREMEPPKKGGWWVESEEVITVAQYVELFNGKEAQVQVRIVTNPDEFIDMVNVLEI